jgi:disulfide oxidoreductase YuzD
MKNILIASLLLCYTNAADLKALLFNGNCTTCHFINEDKSAPSMKKIKTAYIKAFPDKKEFVNYMYIWVKQPNKKSSLLRDEIEKHELMPEIYFEDETLKQIIEYIYDTI